MHTTSRTRIATLAMALALGAVVGPSATLGQNPCEPWQGPPAAPSGNHIVVLASSGEVVAFTADGSEAWRVPATGFTATLSGEHTIDSERVYVRTPDAVVALALSDGSEAWRLPIDMATSANQTGTGRPAVHGGIVYVVVASSPDGRAIERDLLALDAFSGSESWRQPLFADLPAGPVAVDEQHLVVWGGRGDRISFDPFSGAERWRSGLDVLGIVATGPVAMADGFVATILAGGEVVVLSADDGSRLWSITPIRHCRSHSRSRTASSSSTS